MCPNRVPPRATTTNPALAVWLAGVEARALFNPLAQSAADLARWQELSSPRRLQEWEVSRALLARALGFGANAADFASADERAVSLSHAASHAAVAVSEAAACVGVDLETVRERDFLRLSRFAFAEAEHAALEALPPAERAERFYILWTLKESFTKALGQPLLATVRQCTFTVELGEWRASVPTTSEWVARVFRPRPQLVLSVVALLRHSPHPGNLSVSTHEWPGGNVSSWPTLATLASDASVAWNSGAPLSNR